MKSIGLYSTIITTNFKRVYKVVRGHLRLIRTELDGYVVLQIISPIIYSDLVIHYIHFLFILISDQVAKWFKINMKKWRQFRFFLLAYSIWYHNSCLLSWENAMPKAITEVYFALSATNFYAQTSYSCHSKFVKIISIRMHRIAITVFVSISFPASTKMFWLVTCHTNSGQK